jgi:hypothetical protein
MERYTPGWALLGQTVQQRRARLGGPSTATVRIIESGAEGNYRSKTLMALDAALGWPRGASIGLVEGEVPTTSWWFTNFDEFVDFLIKDMGMDLRDRHDAPVIPAGPMTDPYLQELGAIVAEDRARRNLGVARAAMIGRVQPEEWESIERGERVAPGIYMGVDRALDLPLGSVERAVRLRQSLTTTLAQRDVDITRRAAADARAAERLNTEIDRLSEFRKRRKELKAIPDWMLIMELAVRMQIQGTLTVTDLELRDAHGDD